MQHHRLHLPSGSRASSEGASRVRLEAEPAAYLLRVLRLGVGAALELFDGEGRVCEACIESIDGRTVSLGLGAWRAGLPRPPPFALVQAVLKGEKMDWLVQKCTELGVSEIWPVITARTIVRLDARKARARQLRWEKIAEASTRQCGRADLPRIHLPGPLDVALDTLGERGEILRLLAWEETESDRGLRSVLGETRARGHALVVGPEGGLEAEEVQVARLAGFREVSLGRRILRAETAGPAVLTAVRFTQGELGA